MRKFVFVAVALAAVLAGRAAPAAEVDLLLVLAADVSRSVDEGEFDLQRQGYAAALMNPLVLRAIAGGANGAVAISFVEWSGDGDEQVVVDWTIVHDGEDAGSLAAAILKAPRSSAGRTSISGAIDFAMTRFGAAAPTAARHVIDISGDGTNNSGRSVTEARDQAVAQGVTINGLAIINDRPNNSGYAFHTRPPGGLPNYYRDNVIGGPGCFVKVVQDFTTFGDALTDKLVSEIAAAPRNRRVASRR